MPANEADIEAYQCYFPGEIFQKEDGSWMTFKDVNGHYRELVHEKQYSSFAQACMAMVEDFHSGALEIKMQITSTTLTPEQSNLMHRALAIFEGRVVAN